MDLSIIENDPREVKKYLQNFVPINYYRVLDDAYLYQVRAVLLHSVSKANEFNPKYDGLFNDLNVSIGNNAASITVSNKAWSDAVSSLAERTTTIAAETASAKASIVTVERAFATTNAAQASVNTTLTAAIKDVIIGGRNLLVNSTFEKGYEVWQEATITKIDHYIGPMHRIDAAGLVGSLMGIKTLPKYSTMRLTEGKQYSISFYGNSSLKVLDEVYLTKGELAPIKLVDIVTSLDISERRHIVFTSPISGNDIGLIIGTTATSTQDWFNISLLKVEMGNKATDWTPAPEDVDGYISSVQATINEFKEVQVSVNEASAIKSSELDARTRDNRANILEESRVRTDLYSAQATKISNLEVSTGVNSASINRVEQVFTDKDSASAQRIDVLEATTETSSGKITNLERVTSTTNEALAEQSTVLSAKIDNVSIGGRNLLQNSDFKLGFAPWGTVTGVETETILGNTITLTNTGSKATYFGIEPLTIHRKIAVMIGVQYTLSFYTKGSVTELNDIWFKSPNKAARKLATVVVTPDLGIRSEITFTAAYTTSEGSIVIGTSNFPINAWFSVVATKFEKGNKATDWTVAPEDIGRSIKEVQASITEFKGVYATDAAAIALKFTNLDSEYGGNSSNISTKLTALTNEDIAINSKLVNLTSNFEGNSSRIEQEEITRSTAISAVALDINNLTTRTSTAEGKITNLQLSSADNAGAIALVKENLRAEFTEQLNSKGGGRNLLLDSEYWWKRFGTVGEYLGYPVVASRLSPFTTVHLSGNQKYSLDGLKSGETYTWSMLVAYTGTKPTAMTWYSTYNQSYKAVTNFDNINETEFTRIWVTGPASSNKLTANFHFNVSNEAGQTSTIYITNMKVEKGEVASDWEEAPEDTGKSIKQTNANIEAFKVVVATQDQATAANFRALEATSNSGTARIEDLEYATSSPLGAVAIKLNNLSAVMSQEATDKANAAKNAALEIANGKGEIIYSTSQPPLAKRLTQNLWIDTTGGLNVPKRWNGSIWEIVTDSRILEALEKAKSALSNTASLSEQQGVFADELDSLAGQILTINRTVNGEQQGIEVVSALGDLNKLKHEIAKARIDKDIVNLEAQIIAINAVIDGYNAKITALTTARDAEQAKADSNPVVVAKYNKDITEINGFKTDIINQRNLISIQKAKLISEKAILDSLVLTESKIKAQHTVKLTAGGKVAGTSLIIDGTNVRKFDVLVDEFTMSVDDSSTGIKPFKVTATGFEINVPLAANSSIESPYILGGTISGSYMTAGTFLGGQIGIGSHTVATNGVITEANFRVTSDGTMYAKAGVFSGLVTGGSININNMFLVDALGNMTAKSGTFNGNVVIGDGTITLDKLDKDSIPSLSALSANIGHFKSAATGARLEIKDSLLSVYDSNNKLRVRMGIW